MKASTKRQRNGQTQVRGRTKPTTGDLGPRDPGPHGLTLDQRPRYEPPPPPSNWMDMLFGRGKVFGPRKAEPWE